VTFQRPKFHTPFKTGLSVDDRLMDFIRRYLSVILLSLDSSSTAKSRGDSGSQVTHFYVLRWRTV
jgi:hypothetical protein